MISSRHVSFRRRACLGLACLLLALSTGCSRPAPPKVEAEEETPSRTEFTSRIENFFEYEPLKAGKPSRFLIHLTDLVDGAPVEKAEVVLSVRRKNGEIAKTTARVGKVTGIYVADLTIPGAGPCDIEFHVTREKLDERLPLTGFHVE